MINPRYITSSICFNACRDKGNTTDFLTLNTSSYTKGYNNGSHFGIDIEYKAQEKTQRACRRFYSWRKNLLVGDTVCLILGDNVFYGQGFGSTLRRVSQIQEGAIIFGYYVTNPDEFGVVEFDEDGNVLSFQKKSQLNQNRTMLFQDCISTITQLLKRQKN